MGETKITKKSKILIIPTAETTIGYVVNDVSNIVSLKKSELEPVPDIIKHTGKKYIAAIVHRENKLLSIINAKEILTLTEVKGINNVLKNSK